MDNPNGGLGAVDVLTARAARAVSINPQIGRIYHDVDFLSFGHDDDSYRAGMNSSAALCDGDSLHAMSSAFVLELTECARALDRENNFLKAAQIRRA